MEEELLDLLTFFTQTFAEEITQFKYKNIPLGKDAFIIEYIGKRTQCTQSDLIQGLLLSKSATSRRISRLVDLGLIFRTKREIDHRWEDLTLTQLGNQVYEHFYTHRKILLKTLIHGLTPEQIGLFQDILRNFYEVINRYNFRKKK